MISWETRCLTWLLEVFIFIGIALSLLFAGGIWYLTPETDYLEYQISRNWDRNYIVDIKLTKNDTCPDQYYPQLIGLWSGFKNGSCFCRNKLNQFQFASENKRECDRKQNEDNFECFHIPETSFSFMKKYKGYNLCVLKANDSFNSLFDNIRSNTTDLNSTSLQNYNISSLIDPRAIIDIKIVDIAKYPEGNIMHSYGIDLSKHETRAMDNNTNLYFKRRNQSYFSVADADNLISDIHLFNELWCSYLDISNPFFNFNNKIYEDEYYYGGYNYCEEMFEDSLLFYHDDFKRTSRINFEFDTSVSLYDFYSGNEIAQYYDNNFHKNSSHIVLLDFKENKDFQPILVYEKYYMGMACKFLESPDSHLNYIKNGHELKRIMGGSILISVFFVFLGVFFLIFKIGKCNKILIFLTILIFIFVIINMILVIYFAKTAKNTWDYLKMYRQNCQIDWKETNYNDAVKTTPMEMQYEMNLFRPLSGSVLYVLDMIFVLLFLICYLILETCCKKKNVNIGEQNVEIYQFKHIDEDHSKSKI